MNDIDRRCDAYLAWLDNKKRSANPILQQISDTRSVTEAIMRIAGASADSIVITGLAFGLAASTFTNINSRLVLEVDHTTVQTVVLTTQKKYRLWIRGEIIDNKPAAIHALRSYLRLCMPFTIETEINMTATIVQRGGAAAVAAIERDPLINPATVGVAVRSGAGRAAGYSQHRATAENGSAAPKTIPIRRQTLRERFPSASEKHSRRHFANRRRAISMQRPERRCEISIPRFSIRPTRTRQTLSEPMQISVV